MLEGEPGIRRHGGSARSLAPGAAEAWEELDAQLRASKQEDLVNRIILAHKCIEGAQGGGSLPLKELMADWHRLAKMPDAEIKKLCELVTAETQRFPWLGIVLLAGDLITRKLAQPWQMPVIFAAGTGKDFDETKELIAQLNALAAGSVFARISRMYQAFGPSEDQGV